jgi:chemotaxis protein histidine kinase CheA
MGLSLVRDRIKELQGTVKIQSEQGKGTVFRVQIPLEEAAPETKEETTASA